jgi:hypothetical protein
MARLCAPRPAAGRAAAADGWRTAMMVEYSGGGAPEVRLQPSEAALVIMMFTTF